MIVSLTHVIMLQTDVMLNLKENDMLNTKKLTN
jgi:hypothetical protein